MGPDDRVADERPGGIQSCRACYRPLFASAKFCPACGADQHPTRELERRISRAQESWPKVRNAILFYLVYLGTVIPILWLDEEEAATGMLAVTLVDAFVILVYAHICGVKLGPALRPSADILHKTGLALILLMPVLAANLGYHLLLQRLFGVELVSLSDPFEVAGYPIWAVILITCAMPAIWEELAFRGLIQVQLGEVVRPREAIVLTSVLFAIIHCSAFSGVYLFLFSIGLGVLRNWSRSLLPCMAVHFVHNLAVVVMEELGVGV